ncbi:hypothetical protein ScPMuIL_008685 [Solemya velum]
MTPVTSATTTKSDQGRGDTSGDINEVDNVASGGTTIKLDVHVSGLDTETAIQSDLKTVESVAVDKKQYEYIDKDGNIERIAIKTTIKKTTNETESNISPREDFDSQEHYAPANSESSPEVSLLSSEPASWLEITDTHGIESTSGTDSQIADSFKFLPAEANLPTVGSNSVSSDLDLNKSSNDFSLTDSSIVIIEKTDELAEEGADVLPSEQTDVPEGDETKDDRKVESSPPTAEMEKEASKSYRTNFTWKSSSPAPADHSKEKSPSPSELILKDHTITVVKSESNTVPAHPEDIIGLSEEEIKNALLTSQTSPEALSPGHAEVLVRLLSHPSVPLQQSALGNISRCAVFTPNQNILRENGCLPKLSDLLEEQTETLHGGYRSSESQVMALTTAVTNMAMNEKNHKQLGNCVPSLVNLSLEEETGESVCLTSLQALTNLSVTSQHHGHYTRLVQRLYELLDTQNTGVKLQALKILVNLSCNVDMVPHLLAAKAPDCILDLLGHEADERMVLRWTTLLANILRLVHEKQLTQSSLPTDDKAPSPETMFSALYSVSKKGQLKNKVFLLCKHSNDEIKDNAAKIYSHMSSGN